MAGEVAIITGETRSGRGYTAVISSLVAAYGGLLFGYDIGGCAFAHICMSCCLISLTCCKSVAIS